MTTETRVEPEKKIGTLTLQLHDLCKCGHERALHAHSAAFCTHIAPGFLPCTCDRFRAASR